MFRSRSKRRQNRSTRSLSGSLRRLSERLGVEALESRTMLAATGLDLVPTAMPVAQFSFDNTPVGMDQGAVRDKVLDRLTESPEGGYLQTLLEGDIINASSVSGIRVDVARSTLGGGHLIDVIQGNVNSYFPNLSSDYFDFTRDQFDVGGLDVYGRGIEPANFIDAQNSPETLSDTETSVALNNDSKSREKNEGGPISIPVILASREAIGGSPYEPTTGTKALATSTRVEATSHSATDSLALNAVAAEWARAMVLETAGGEPDGAIPTSAVHQGAASRSLDVPPNARSGEPLSSALPSDNVQKTDAPNTHAAPTGQAATSEAHSPTTFLAASLEGITLPDANANVTVGPDQQVSPAEETSVPGATASGLPSSILDAALEKVGYRENSLLQSLADASWRRPLEAAPLLMMLALERISAGNSRRANREAVAAAGLRRKVHRPGDDDDRS